MFAGFRFRTLILAALISISSVVAVAAPGITSISPTVGPVSPVGSAITITGTGFGATQDTSSITIGGVASAPTSWSDSRIVAPVPSSLLPGFADVVVTVAGVSSNAQSFLVIPVITAASPATAPVGGPVTITGTSFGDTQGSSTVTFNGVPAVPSTWSNTSITFPIPVGASSGAIVVTINGFETNGDPYPVSPAIASLSPASGSVSSTLTINGSGFGAAQNFNPVIIGGVSVTPSFWSDTSIQVPVDTSLPAGTASVVVTVNAIASNAASFLVTPSITALSANSGLVGDSITIAGTSFGGTQGASSISFNGLAATPSVWTDTSITVPVPTGASTGPVLVTVNGVSSNLVGFTVLVPPSITSLSVNSGFAGTRITITGSNFDATQGSGTVQIGGQPMIVSSWSDSSIDVVVPAEALTGDIVVTSGVGLASNPVTFTVNFGGPVLQVAVSDAPLQVNLTSSQTLDWIHWGRISETLPDRKNGVTPLISDYTLINSTQAQVFPENIAFSWTDGNHPPVVSETFADVETYDPGSGFQITVPADTTVKTLNLYAEVFSGQAILHASLSDGSAADITDQSVTDSDVGSKVYSIDFRAASPGQTLTVTFTGAAGAGGVGLQAATVTPHLPVVNITSPVAAQSYPAGSPIPLTVAASQLDSSISALAALATDGSSFTATSAPLSANWQPASSGHYVVNANALDTTGLTNAAPPVEVDVVGQGGTLSVLRADAPSFIDLSVTGTADWVLWGPLNTGDFIINNPGNVLGRKTGVAPLITDYRPIGNHFMNPRAFANGISFSDSSQNFFSSGSQLQVFGRTDGYEISAPADTTTRTLQLYVGAVLARGKLSAFLSDGSAVVVNDLSFDDPNGPDFSGFGAQSVYSITYSAASAGQTLTVRYTMDFDYGNGQVALLGAALDGSPLTPTVPAPQIASLDPTSAAINTRITISGSNFGPAQGDGLVFIGGVDAQVVTWSDASIVAIVPSGLTGGQSVDVQIIADTGISNTVSLNVLSYKVQPQDLNMVVGDSRTLLVTDLSGNPISGIGWATSDSTIVTLSTDDPPVITAVGVGSAKVWAGDIPVSVTVFAAGSLPAGTPLWTLPVGGGSGNISLVPAVPSDSGADVFALDDSGTLTAISSDGFPVWKVTGVQGGSSAKVIPDFSGNALLIRPYQYTDADGFQHETHDIATVDPASNQFTRIYAFNDRPTNDGQSFTDDQATQVTIPHPKGPLFVLDNQVNTCADCVGGAFGKYQVKPFVHVLDPKTSGSIADIPLETSTFEQFNVIGHLAEPPFTGKMIVAGDGNAYVPYLYFTENEQISAPAESDDYTSHLMLLRVSPDGTFAKTELNSWTGTYSIDSGGVIHCSGAVLAPPPFGALTLNSITNMDQGVAVSVSGSFRLGFVSDFSSNRTDCAPMPPDLHQFIYASQDSITSQDDLPADVDHFNPALQREDGSYIGTDASGELLAVNHTGTPVFQTKINPDRNGNGTLVNPLYALTDGGSIVTSTTTDSSGATVLGSLFTTDANGTVVLQEPDSGAILAWSGKRYGVGSLPGSIASYSFRFVDTAWSFWPFQKGNASGTSVPPTLQMTHMFPDPDLAGSSPNQIKTDILRAVPLNPKTDLLVSHKFLFGSDVTPAAFLREIDRPLDGVGFIGHSNSVLFSSIPGGTLQRYAVGLVMGSQSTPFGRDMVIIKSTATPPAGLEVLLPQNLDQAFPTDNALSAEFTRVAKLTTHAKVVFIGACDLADAFKYWWNINGTTTRQALIVPSNSDVLLGVARFEWTVIAQELAQGKTISQAVNDANSSIHVPGVFKDSAGNSITIPSTLDWSIIGDTTLTLRKKPQ